MSQTIELVDTHCHIHVAHYPAVGSDPTHALWQRAGATNGDDIVKRALAAGVTRMLCVGTSAPDSELAVRFVQGRPNCWAVIGIHPHEAKDGEPAFRQLEALLGEERVSHPSPTPPSDASKIVAIGECGLDYFYSHSPKEEQITALHFQLNLAQKYSLPVVFHVRDAFDDFWPIFDQYPGIRGVLHSFTDSQANANKAMERGLLIGVNGIVTFTKNDWQHDLVRKLPLQYLLLETDAPYLTPAPHRGTINEPERVRLVADFLAKLRSESRAEIAAATTENARELFRI